MSYGRKLRFEDKINYSNLRNFGCQNKLCRKRLSNQCDNCRGYEEPNYLEYLLNTKRTK
jgi:hypothetical protein